MHVLHPRTLPGDQPCKHTRADPPGKRYRDEGVFRHRRLRWAQRSLCTPVTLHGLRSGRQLNIQLTRSLTELSAAAREYGVSFSVENMGDWEYFFLKTPEELPLIEGYNFTLDVGHAHQNHYLKEFLAVPAQHYHLHDNDGMQTPTGPLAKVPLILSP